MLLQQEGVEKERNAEGWSCFTQKLKRGCGFVNGIVAVKGDCGGLLRGKLLAVVEGEWYITDGELELKLSYQHDNTGKNDETIR